MQSSGPMESLKPFFFLHIFIHGGINLEIFQSTHVPSLICWAVKAMFPDRSELSHSLPSAATEGTTVAQ